METDDVAGLLDKRLREAVDGYLDLVRARLVKWKLHHLARAVEDLQRRNVDFPLLACRRHRLRPEGERLLLADPAAGGNDDCRVSLGVVERVADDGILDRQLEGPVGDAFHVGPETEVVHVELSRLWRRVAVAPVVLAYAVELDGIGDRLLVLADGFGEEHLKLLPLARQGELALGIAWRMHGDVELVCVRVHKIKRHSPRVVIAKPRPAGELHRLSGKNVLLRRGVPPAEGVVAVARLEAYGLGLRRRIGRALVESDHIAAARDPCAGFPCIHLGIADVARDEFGVCGERSHDGNRRQAE